MSRRADSIAISTEEQNAIKNGTATVCIGAKCCCWTVCSSRNHRTPRVCPADLQTDFYKEFKSEEGYYRLDQILPLATDQHPKRNDTHEQY